MNRHDWAWAKVWSAWSSHPPRMAVWTTPGAPIRRGRRCGPRLELPSAADSAVDRTNTPGTPPAVFIRAGCEHTLRSSKPTLGWKYKRASPKGTYKDVRSSLIQNGRKLKTTQTPVSSRIHEVWNIHKTDLLAKKYERTIGSNTGKARADLLNLHFEQMSTAFGRHGGPAHYLGHPYTKIYYSIESRH